MLRFGPAGTVLIVVRFALLVLLLLATGCVTVAPASKATPAALGPVAPLEPTDLQGRLERFAQRARQQRALTVRGATMPVPEAQNWHDVLNALDELLGQRPTQTSSYDVSRARVTTEAELEMDGRAYGDIPLEIAEGVADHVARLVTRLGELRRLQSPVHDIKPLLAWPVDPVAVTSLFGRRFHPIFKEYRQHDGIDLAAEAGQLVTSAAKGTVIRAAWSGGHGYRVEIQHANHVITGYSHLVQLLVEPGLMIQQGDPIGLAGSTGQTTGVHLHFEVWQDGRPHDPLDQLPHPKAMVQPLARR